MCVDGVELDARDGRLRSRRPMHLQTPVLSRPPLIRVDVPVLVSYIICGSTRIPYTKLAVFIFTKARQLAILAQVSMWACTHHQRRSGLRWGPDGTPRCTPCPGSPSPSRRSSYSATARAAQQPPRSPFYPSRIRMRPGPLRGGGVVFAVESAASS
jgi:hypothetical protein